MNKTDAARPDRRFWVWPLASVVLGFLAGRQWLRPLAHPHGYYAGVYKFADIELGTVLTLVWLAVFVVTLSPARWRRPLALRVGTAVGAALFTIAFCDLAYTFWSVRFGHVLCGRHAFPRVTTQADPELIFKHRPGIRWQGRKTPECDFVDFRTDEKGFRNPSGIRRADLVFIGDSVTEAGEVTEETTFVRQTARTLGRTAVNLGVFCYGPQQELVVLKRYGFDYQPHTVIWQVTEWNDVFDAERYHDGKTDGWKLMTWKELYENHSPVVKLIAKLFPPVRKNTVDFVRSDGITDRRVIWPFFNPVPACPTGLAETLRVLKEARALCRQRNIDFVVLLVPSHHRILAPWVKPHSVEEALRYHPPAGLDEPNDMAHVLADFCRSNECAFVDVVDDLRRRAAKDNRNIFVRNDTHLGADAHEEVARVLVRTLGATDAVAGGAASTAVR